MEPHLPSAPVAIQTLLAPALLLAAHALLVAGDGANAEPQPPGVTGVLRHHLPFPSVLVAPRNVDVWLPPTYETVSGGRYPVVYMHDGQNLFDPATSFIGVDWGIDETMTRLIAERRIREAIVVGIWNTPKRREEYLPAKMFLSLKEGEEREAAFRGLADAGIVLDEPSLLSDAYLRFLVTELKPFIDRTYRTLPGRDDTFIMGSSAGALVSLYAVSEYPEVFGGAGCVSTHWPVGDGMMIDYIKDRLPAPETHKIYFDFGTETLDRGYEPYQKLMDQAMEAAGYERDRNWMTMKFPGAEHSERAWRERVHVPLEFFLRN
jgi:predicted alpha/beta superfamily hydrolase